MIFLYINIIKFISYIYTLKILNVIKINMLFSIEKKCIDCNKFIQIFLIYKYNYLATRCIFSYSMKEFVTHRYMQINLSA